MLSQLISLLFLLCGDSASAWRVQQKFLNALTKLLFLPFRVLFLALHCGASVSRPLSVAHRSPLSDWMHTHFADTAFGALTVPGTHNAHSFRLRRAVCVVCNFAQWQSLSVYRQLMAGARCVDLRVCHFEEALWCAHGAFVSVPLDLIIRQTLRFLRAHPNEIVIVRAKTEWRWRSDRVSAQQLRAAFENCADAMRFCAPWDAGAQALSPTPGVIGAHSRATSCRGLFGR